MPANDNMAPGQQHEPHADKSVYRADLPDGEEIIEGAHQEDQLDKLKENAAGHPSQHHIGASPSTGELSQEDINNDIKPFEEQPNGHPALETKEGKSNGAIPKAFEGQRSNHP